MKKALKIIGITLLVLILVAVLAVGAYVIYVVAEYDRIPDNQSLEIAGGATARLQKGTEYTVITYNIGFGAYTPDFSFFMKDAVLAADSPFVISAKSGKNLPKEEVW